MKKRFDIEISDSKEVCGGYVCTTAPMTKRQVQKEMERMGRELISNSNGRITRVSYSAWDEESADASPEEIESGKFINTYVTLIKDGRKVRVLAY